MAKAKKDTKKKSALEAFKEAQAKILGEDALEDLSKLGKKVDPSKFLSTGVPQLDQLLGGYGHKKGSITLLAGKSSSGKTSLVYHMLAEAQKEGCVLFIDSETTFDKIYAQEIGLSTHPDKLVYNQPVSGEKAYQLAIDAVNSGAFSMIAIDSVAALLSEKQIESDLTTPQVAGSARLNTISLMKLQPLCAKKGVPMVLVTQLRDNIGSMGRGPAYKLAGGHALRYVSSAIIQITYTGKLTQGDRVFGQTTKMQLDKCKYAVPRNHVTVNMVYGRGYCPAYGLLCAAEEAKVIVRKGAWYSFGEHKFCGADATVEAIREDEELKDAIKAAISKTKLQKENNE